MAQPLTPSGRHRHRRWPWVVGLPLVALLGYFVVAPLVQAAVLHGQLSAETASARTSALPGADAAHATWLPKTSAALGLGRSVYSATYDVCWVDHSDGGWLAVNYNQRCRLSYVDFFVLPKPNTAVTAALEDARTSPYGTRTSGLVWTDDYLRAAGLKTANPPEDQPVEFWATLSGATDAKAATDSWMLTFGQDGSVVAYAVDDAFAGRQLITESGSPSLVAHSQYVVLARGYPYFEKNIGCAIGRPMFCQSPLGDG